MYNEIQKNILLTIAKQAIENAVAKQTSTKSNQTDPILNEIRGCFVTLKNGHNLRGCIGQFVPNVTLAILVDQMAKAASTEDSRFFSNPITAAEFSQLNIEISVLSPLEKTSDPMSLILGVHGIYVTKAKGTFSGCFLPQVAIEAGWNKEEFLSFCCSHKAGLKPDAWKDDDCEVYLFRAEIFNANFDEI